ncbi:MAG: pteridine reductase [Chromatiales bacterium]
MSRPSENAVLITGAADRIGAQIARRLHQAGMDIALHYRNSKQKAEALRDELLEGRSNSVALFQADLLEMDQIQPLIDQVVQHFGGLTALINNASSFYPTPVGEITQEHWRDLVGSNMQAPLFLSQAAALHLQQSNGCIVNIVDVHAFRPMHKHTLYCMAKAANAMLVKSLARELAPQVRVNGVAPGLIAWPADEPDEATKQHIMARVPLQRQGEFDDIAKTVQFLIQDAPYVTGQIIAVDGGRMTQQ